MKLDINKLRLDITKIDNEIIKLIKARSLVSLKIGKYKIKNGLKILDKKREKEIFQKYTKNFKIEDELYIKNIFKQIFNYSKKLQKDLF